MRAPVRLLQIVLITVFGRLPTGWECVRLLVQKAWPWLTLSDMFFHLLVVHLLMPDVTLQIHLQKVALDSGVRNTSRRRFSGYFLNARY